MFKKLSLLLVLVVALVFGVASVSAENGNAELVVVHGIPDVTVDVCLDGAVAIPNFNFTDIAGPIPVAANTYDVSVAPAGLDCADPVLGPLSLTFDAGVSYSIVAHLTEAAAPTASVFVNDISPTGSMENADSAIEGYNYARISAHHTAAAPTVDLFLRRVRMMDTESLLGSGKVIVRDFTNGDQAVADVKMGDYRGGIKAGGELVFGPFMLEDLQPNTNYLVFAVGVFPDTFTLLVQPIPTMMAN